MDGYDYTFGQPINQQSNFTSTAGENSNTVAAPIFVPVTDKELQRKAALYDELTALAKHEEWLELAEAVAQIEAQGLWISTDDKEKCIKSIRRIGAAIAARRGK